MSLEIQSARGPYRISLAKAPESFPDAILLTLSFERLDGIEKVALQFRIARAIVEIPEPESMLARLAPWIERDFEMTREAALKSIRSERKLMVISFGEENRGPF